MKRRIVHAIHDFLPVHRAGAEIYVAALCRALAPRHHVTVLTTEYDLTRRHGDMAWRLHDGLSVVEIVNNWEGATFEDSYRASLITERIAQVLDTIQPHVVHVHSLLNLSFDLPALARRRGSAVVATLHDYTLVCPSGGQRLHRAESYLCREIDPARCARCFPDTAFHTKLSVGRLSRRSGSSTVIRHAAGALQRHAPVVARTAAHAVSHAAAGLTAQDITRRLDAAQVAMGDISLFVSPSPSMAEEYCRLGVPGHRMQVSDYGFPSLRSVLRPPAPDSRLRIGYVGTLVWHKGVHVLIDAVRREADGNMRLEVFGDPRVSPDYVADLRARAAGAPIEFKGPFASDDAAVIYAGLDVLVVPSLWLENSPLVIHEAFQAGVPVIGSRLGGIADLIADGVNGLLVAPGSAEALASALRGVATDRALLERFRAQLPAVKSIEQDAAEWEARYAEVLSAGA